MISSAVVKIGGAMVFLSMVGCPPAAFVRGPQFLVEPFAREPEVPTESGQYGWNLSLLHADPEYPRMPNVLLAPVNLIGTLTLNILPLVAVVRVPNLTPAGSFTFWHFEVFGVCFPVHGGLPCTAVMWDVPQIPSREDRAPTSQEDSAAPQDR